MKKNKVALIYDYDEDGFNKNELLLDLQHKWNEDFLNVIFF